MNIAIPLEYHRIARRNGRESRINSYEVLLETPSSFLVEISYGAGYNNHAVKYPIYKSQNYDENKHKTGQYCWIQKHHCQILHNFKDNEDAIAMLLTNKQ